MGKRSAKFLGSQMWRNRDVRVDKQGGATPSSPLTIRVTDLPSNISVFSSSSSEAELLARLAHRVHQFE